MAKIKVGQPARIIFRSEPEHSYPGQVARLGVEVDKETREFVVDVHVAELPAHWAIGQRTEVYIETATKNNALIIPAKFIKWQGNQSGAFTNNEGAAAWHPVELGLHWRGLVEIVKGLEEGDRIVNSIKAKDRLADHMRISVQ